MAVAAIIKKHGDESAGCYGEPSTSFEDDATYYVLAPYLNDTGAGIGIDAYDGGEFADDLLTSLAARLRNALNDLGAKSQEWVVRFDRWTQGGKEYSKEYRANRERVIRVASDLLELAERAHEEGSRLVFVGD